MSTTRDTVDPMLRDAVDPLDALRLTDLHEEVRALLSTPVEDLDVLTPAERVCWHDHRSRVEAAPDAPDAAGRARYCRLLLMRGRRREEEAMRRAEEFVGALPPDRRRRAAAAVEAMQRRVDADEETRLTREETICLLVVGLALLLSILFGGSVQ